LKGNYWFFFYVQKIQIWFLFSVKKYIAVGAMIVFCVVFCRSVIVLFLLAIVLPALALGDLKILLALFLKQKRVRKFTWLDPIQCEKNTCTIFNRVQFSLKTRVQFYVIRQQMKQKKLVCNFTSLDTKWSKKKHVHAILHCHCRLWAL
jgi:hypothetical protein